LIFAGICYEAYKAFKYLDYIETNEAGPLIGSKKKSIIDENESVKSIK